MASSVDSSVKRMIARVNELETARRLVMMRLKEAEVNLTYLTEEQVRHKQNNAALCDKETALMRQLQNAVEDQRILENRHRKHLHMVDVSIKEEPRLLQIAQEKIHEATGQRDQWMKRAESLITAQRKWKSTEECTEEKKAQLDALLAQIQQLESEEQSLLAEEAEAALARQLQRQQQMQQQQQQAVSMDHNNNNNNNTTTALNGAVGTAAALAGMKARMEADATSAEEYVIQSNRQCSIVQREVTDLEKRMAEFRQWLGDSNATKHQLEADVAEIQLALNRKICSQCC